MGVYIRADSPFYWVLLERPSKPALKESTKIPIDAPDAMSRRLLRQQAQEIYNARMTALARTRHDLPAVVTTIGFTVYARWYDTHVIAKHRGKDRERAALDRLKAHFRARDLSTITAASVSEYETSRDADGVKASTVNREVAVLKAMLVAAVPKHLKASPLAGRKQLRAVPIRKRVLSPEEETRLLAAMRSPIDRALFVLAVDTLIRLSNAINLSRAEDKGTHLELVDSKTGAYDVPLSRRARAALDALPTKGAYYFPNRRKAKNVRDTRGAVRRLLQRACARCEPPIPYGRAVAGITWHTATRASGATRMLRHGVDPRTVQEIGHWASLEQMSDYLITDDTLKRAAVEKIAPPITSPARNSEQSD